MAWPIQPMVRPRAKSVSGVPFGSLRTRASTARAKSMVGFSWMIDSAADASARANVSSGDFG